MAELIKKFKEVFSINPDESINPISKIRIGVANLGPNFTIKNKRTIFSGINIHENIGKDILYEMDGETLVIKSFKD